MFPLKSETSPTSPGDSVPATSPTTATTNTPTNETTTSPATATSTRPSQPSTTTAQTQTHPQINGTAADHTAELNGTGSIPASSTTAEPTEVKATTIVSPIRADSAGLPSSPIVHSPHTVYDTGVPTSPKASQKERSSTIDEAVAAFHEAVGHSPKEPKEPREDVTTISEDPHDDHPANGIAGSAQEESFWSPADTEEPTLAPVAIVEVEEPSFRQHTPTHPKGNGSAGDAAEEEDTTGEEEAEGTTMDEIDLN